MAATAGRIIGYIVLPPGHGKSYYHDPKQNIFELDTIYNCKGDPALAEMRKQAKQTGEWEQYDEAWVSRVIPLLPQSPCVVLVPSEDVGEALDAVWLGSAQLSRHQWQENLKGRGKQPEDYEWGTRRPFEVLLFETNDTLDTWLHIVVKAWISARTDSLAEQL